MCAKPISAAEPTWTDAWTLAGRSGWIRACALTTLAERSLVPIFVAGRHFLLVQNDDALFAVERACPHEGADLALGHCTAGRLHCPRHQASFSLSDGTVSPGWSFPGLQTFASRCVGGDVEIWIGTFSATENAPREPVRAIPSTGGPEGNPLG